MRASGKDFFLTACWALKLGNWDCDQQPAGQLGCCPLKYLTWLSSTERTGPQLLFCTIVVWRKLSAWALKGRLKLFESRLKNPLKVQTSRFLSGAMYMLWSCYQSRSDWAALEWDLLDFLALIVMLILIEYYSKTDGEKGRGKKYCDCEIKVWEKLRNIACKCKSFNGGKIGKMDSCQEEQLSSTGKYYAHCKRSILKKTNRGVFYGHRPGHLYIYALYPCRLCGILGHGFEIWNASCRQWQPGRLPHHFPLLVRTGRCLAASQEGWNGSDAVLV